LQIHGVFLRWRNESGLHRENLGEN